MMYVNIKGWETEQNKAEIGKLLRQTLEVDKEGSERLANTIHAGKALRVKVGDWGSAHDLADKLTEIGAKVEIESE
jgi:hypothetical protein